MDHTNAPKTSADTPGRARADTEPSGFERARALYVALRSVGRSRRDEVLQPLEGTEPQLARAVRLMLEFEDDEDGTLGPFANPVMPIAAIVDEALSMADASTAASADRAEAATVDTPSDERRASGPATNGIDFGPKYRLLSYIGRGSAGEVHLAEQLHPVRRQVALKLFPWSRPLAKERRRFEREALALARLTHPGIAQVHEASTTPDGRLFIAMEHVPGAPIDEACARLGLTLHQRLGLLTQVCEAVEHAHQRGVIHRDLKPTNLLVIDPVDRARTGPAGGPAGGPRGTDGSLPTVKVIDFGIARLLDEDSDAGHTITGEGEVVGTLNYMSPEQRVGGGVDRRSDVYAIGRLMAQLVSATLSGAVQGADRGADHGGTAAAALPRHQRADLRAIVRTATAVEPDDRYSTPMALADDLRRLLADRPVHARRTGNFTRAMRLGRRHPAMTIVLTMVAIVLVALAAMLVQSRSSLAANRDELSAKRDQLETELLRTRTLTVELLDDVLDKLYPVVGAGDARQALTAMLHGHTSALLALHSDDLQLRKAHARLVVELGNHEFEATRFDSALALRAEAVTLFDELAALRPDSIPLRRRQAEAIVRLGDVLFGVGRVADGRDEYRRAFEIHRALGALHPDHPGVLDDLTWSFDRQWSYHEVASDSERIMALIDARMALAERLLELDPTRILSHFTMMDGHRVHALALGALNRHAESLDASRRAVEIGRRLVNESPHILYYRFSLAFTLLQAAGVAKAGGEHELRLELLREADHIAEGLIAEDPNHNQAVTVRVIVIQSLLELTPPDLDAARQLALVAELNRLVESE